MNSILKKTLLAMSVAAAASANAANITANGGVDSAFTGEEWQLVSAEGLAIAGTVSIGTGGITVSVELESSYQETDVLTLTISGATIDADASAPSLDGSAFEVLGVDAETGIITMRPTQGSGGVAAGTFVLSGVVLEEWSGAATLATQGFTVGNFPIDTGAATPIAAVASEISIGAGDTVLNGEIDVEQMRKQFTGSATTTDNFTVDVQAGADLLAVTLGTATLAVTGSDLDFLNDGDGDLDAGSYELDSLTENASETTFEGNTLTVQSSDNVAAGDNAFGLTFTVDGAADEDAQQLTAQSFSADVDVNYSLGGTNGSTGADGVAVGAWTLSGATVNIAYLPFGANISQIVYVSNDGTVNGDIELTAFDDEGESYGPVTLEVSAAAGSVTSLAQSIRNALSAEGFDGTGRLDITLVINSPAADIEVFAAYNVAGDRLSVPVQ